MTELIISALLYLDQSKNIKVQDIVKEIQLMDMNEDCEFNNPGKLQDHKDQMKCFNKEKK